MAENENDNIVYSIYISRELKNEVEQLALISERRTGQLIRHLINIGLEEYKKRELDKFQD